MTGTMTHNILLTRFQREKVLLTKEGSLRTRTVDAMGRQRREGWLQHCPLSYDQARCIHPPFVECYAMQAFSIASDFDPQLMPKIQNQMRNHDEKSLHCHTIHCFASSRSPFKLQLGSWETPQERCLWRNQRFHWCFFWFSFLFGFSGCGDADFTGVAGVFDVAGTFGDAGVFIDSGVAGDSGTAVAGGALVCFWGGKVVEEPACWWWWLLL